MSDLNQPVPELSIVILCYKAEEAIIPFAEKTKELGLGLTKDLEIILVGNYIENSQDKTKNIVEGIAAKDPIFKTVCKPKEGMMGWDMKEGLNSTTGRYICVIDGDGQFPIESIAVCYEKIKTGKYGLVKTYRAKRNDGLYRKTISRVYNSFFKILFPYIRSRDVNSKPKMLSRESYDSMNLLSDDWFIDAEIMISVGRKKIPFYEFPITFYELDGRHSFVKFGAILEFIRNLIVFRIREFRK